MSTCDRCDRPMHPVDASESLYCPQCQQRCAGWRGWARVRSMYEQTALGGESGNGVDFVRRKGALSKSLWMRRLLEDWRARA